MQDYSQPRSAFPKVFQPYKAQELAQPNLGNSPRIDALLHDGKILLSIDDAIALALENNLDLEIARFNLNIAATDLLRAKSGANILGVNTGIVQNTPGGGVGGLGGAVGSGTGGTTIAAGGAGTGTTAWSVQPWASAPRSPASIPLLPAPCNSTRTTRNLPARSALFQSSPKTLTPRTSPTPRDFYGERRSTVGFRQLPPDH